MQSASHLVLSQICGLTVLQLRSERAQYSAQSPRRAAGERNTTILSQLADVPALFHSAPPLQLSIYSNSCLLQAGLWGALLSAGRTDNQAFIVRARRGR